TVRAEGRESALFRDTLSAQLKDIAARRMQMVFCYSNLETAPEAEALARELSGKVDCATAPGELDSSFLLEEAKLALICDKDCYDPSVAECAPPEPAEKTEPELFEPANAELEENSYVVHLDHGIGIYRGLRTLTTSDGAREVMVIEYEDQALLYVPMPQVCDVTGYFGANGGRVKLHRLNSARWESDKRSARRGLHCYAADLLRLQAVRNYVEGIKLHSDPEAEREFNRAFPYLPTPDQAVADEEIRLDMQRTRPMDRLLCGDVGYGKTELAMRAAFRAVRQGYQVAVLAPTTVLTLQHGRSFAERFAHTPFNIATLSRFTPPEERRRILAGLKSGGIDIAIGTHALCSAEVKFKNLGLVVIDEEQRFGVAHKEKLRSLRAEVDVLSMSATPIPRTLYLSMAGARDLSTLMTPPRKRLPVRTIVGPDDAKTVASAIRAELERKGQVFFVHNRVKTIEDACDKLRALVPEARFAFAHGQMREEELSAVMGDFIDRKIDCLVTSTIIESGLDIPNANTIIIERADRFGLAQLHQLRGRVGRGEKQAYAYMLLPRTELISDGGRKRINAIRRCSSLGAGFQLALHDLEIRGSGNLLGAEQSGFLNTIGFELYCRILKQEIAALKGEQVDFRPKAEVRIEFLFYGTTRTQGKLCAAFPPEYIASETLRLAIYRRWGNLVDENQIAAFEEELADRFGKLPEPAQVMMLVAKIRAAAMKRSITRVSVTDGKVLLERGGTLLRDAHGKVPLLGLRNPPMMKLALTYNHVCGVNEIAPQK
ncbi:MAG: transcription-repair coupling factor, partial [Victivallaceae bacterium]|nr:transcription-repair coupling factor [Victivallaceae bacterium]